jgi:hypothetical protein
MKNIYLKLNDNNVVIDVYVAKKPKNKNDKIHQQINENIIEENIFNFLEIIDENGKYNLKYDNALIKMNEKEKEIINQTEEDKLFQQFKKEKEQSEFEKWKKAKE